MIEESKEPTSVDTMRKYFAALSLLEVDDDMSDREIETSYDSLIS